MDQLKDFMKQCVKYRFWIALGFSALLPLIGYFVGAGPIQAKTKTEVTTITNTYKDVQNYLSPGIPNDQYPPIVNDKKAVLTTDVEKAWDKLYARQAPLLKWPANVESRFHTWGRAWPENVDKGAVQQAIGDYVLEYDKAVLETYKKVNPFDPTDGTGIVVVRMGPAMLRPAVFDVAKPPELGKVWAAQERLWIQGTLFDAVAKINGAAKDWDGAVVKEILMMEVGSPAAQDQKSIANGDTVEPAPSLTPGGEAGAAAPAEAPSGMPDPSMMMMMRGSQGMGSGSGGGAAGAAEDVYYLKTESKAYKVLPVQMVVLVDQNRLQEFFIGLENSPMAIQVMEFELQKPLAPVTKPVKGEMMAGGMFGGEGGMGGGIANMRRMSMGMGMQGYGMQGGGGGDPSMMASMMSRGMGGYGTMGGMGGAATPAKAGIDNRSKDAKKAREEKEEKRKKMNRAVDLYYDIVQVTVYGQARFYNPPPPPPATESTSAAAEEPKPAADPGKPADDATKVADPGKPADDSTKVADPGKPADTAKAAATATPKADAVPAEPAPKPDTKAEAKPADAPKPDAKAADTPKAEAKPADTPKK